MTVEWAAPPTSVTGVPSLFLPDVLAALRDAPGRWACIKRAHKSASATSNFQKKHPEYETTTRVVPGGFDLYARYVGDAS